jgi:hypothetical protein
MFRSALCSPFAPAFRFRKCHSIRPCTAQSLSLTEACLRDYRTNLFIQLTGCKFSREHPLLSLALVEVHNQGRVGCRQKNMWEAGGAITTRYA